MNKKMLPSMVALLLAGFSLQAGAYEKFQETPDQFFVNPKSVPPNVLILLDTSSSMWNTKALNEFDKPKDDENRFEGLIDAVTSLANNYPSNYYAVMKYAFNPIDFQKLSETSDLPTQYKFFFAPSDYWPKLKENVVGKHYRNLLTESKLGFAPNDTNGAKVIFGEEFKPMIHGTNGLVASLKGHETQAFWVGQTPTTSAYYDALRYLRGFGVNEDKVGNPPIRWRCQKNFIMYISDGDPQVMDIPDKHLNNIVTSKFNLYKINGIRMPHSVGPGSMWYYMDKADLSPKLDKLGKEGDCYDENLEKTNHCVKTDGTPSMVGPLFYYKQPLTSGGWKWGSDFAWMPLADPRSWPWGYSNMMFGVYDPFYQNKDPVFGSGAAINRGEPTSFDSEETLARWGCWNDNSCPMYSQYGFPKFVERAATQDLIDCKKTNYPNGCKDQDGVSFDAPPFDKQTVTTIAVAYGQDVPILETVKKYGGYFYKARNKEELNGVFSSIMTLIKTLSEPMSGVIYVPAASSSNMSLAEFKDKGYLFSTSLDLVNRGSDLRLYKLENGNIDINDFRRMWGNVNAAEQGMSRQWNTTIVSINVDPNKKQPTTPGWVSLDWSDWDTEGNEHGLNWRTGWMPEFTECYKVHSVFPNKCIVSDAMPSVFQNIMRCYRGKDTGTSNTPDVDCRKLSYSHEISAEAVNNKYMYDVVGSNLINMDYKFMAVGSNDGQVHIFVYNGDFKDLEATGRPTDEKMNYYTDLVQFIPGESKNNYGIPMKKRLWRTIASRNLLPGPGLSIIYKEDRERYNEGYDPAKRTNMFNGKLRWAKVPNGDDDHPDDYIISGSAGNGGKGFFALKLNQVKDMMSSDGAKKEKARSDFILFDTSNASDMIGSHSNKYKHFENIGYVNDTVITQACMGSTLDVCRRDPSNVSYAVVSTSGLNDEENQKKGIFVINTALDRTGVAQASLFAPIPDSAKVKGLAGPAVIDVDKDNIADYAYFGSENGSLYRYDFLTNSVKKIFTQDRPITRPPVLYRRPVGFSDAEKTKPNKWEVTVVFATGSNLYQKDSVDFKGGDVANFVPVYDREEYVYGIVDDLSPNRVVSTNEVHDRAYRVDPDTGYYFMANPGDDMSKTSCNNFDQYAGRKILEGEYNDECAPWVNDRAKDSKVNNQVSWRMKIEKGFMVANDMAIGGLEGGSTVYVPLVKYEPMSKLIKTGDTCQTAPRQEGAMLQINALDGRTPFSLWKEITENFVQDRSIVGWKSDIGIPASSYIMTGMVGKDENGRYIDGPMYKNEITKDGIVVKKNEDTALLILKNRSKTEVPVIDVGIIEGGSSGARVSKYRMYLGGKSTPPKPNTGKSPLLKRISFKIL